MERRKKSAKGASQRACLFKIDNELLEWLDKQPNKGRYVNELIRRDMQASGGDYAAAVEAERQRQAAEAASMEEIDGDAIMRVLSQHGRDKITLFVRRSDYEREDVAARRYDALFGDARAVKCIVPSAHITIAEAEDIKLESCLIARIDAAGLGQLEASGANYVIMAYPTK